MLETLWFFAQYSQTGAVVLCSCLYTNILFPRTADTTDGCLSTRWIYSVTSTKLTLHCDYRVTPRKQQHTKSLLLYGRYFLTDWLSRNHSDSGSISRWHETRRLSFAGCQVNKRLMGTELCLFEIGWIILNNHVSWIPLVCLFVCLLLLFRL
jgi:hypothetical protein